MIKQGNFARPDAPRERKSYQWLVIELATGIVLAFGLSKLPLFGPCAMNQVFLSTSGIATTG
jgi:hypothetical protein